MLTKESFEAAVELMDDDIRDRLHCEMAPCSDSVFIEKYKAEHLSKFGEEFVI